MRFINKRLFFLGDARPEKTKTSDKTANCL